jgi:hypothetical protein
MMAVVACMIALAGASACSSSDAASKDVAVTSCSPSASGGHPTVTGTITNHSRKDSAYLIHVRFMDASGNRVGDGVASVAKVAPLATATWRADDVISAKGPVTCKVASVARTVSV